MPDEHRLRSEICEIGRRVHAQGLVAGTDGNVSVRLDSGRVLITPSGACLGELAPERLVVIDAAGETVAGDDRPSSERWMHLAAYAERPDVMAAVHAHPPTVVAFTLAGVPFSQSALPETILTFGRIPVTDYATPGTKDGAVVVREPIRRHDALVLDRHGSLTVGRTLADAFYKLEKLEHAARVMLVARQLGGIRDLPPAELAKLAELRETLDLAPTSDDGVK